MIKEEQACGSGQHDLDRKKPMLNKLTRHTEGHFSEIQIVSETVDLSATTKSSELQEDGTAAPAAATEVERSPPVSLNVARHMMVPTNDSKFAIASATCLVENKAPEDEIRFIQKVNENLRAKCADQQKQLEAQRQQISMHRQIALDAQMNILRVESERDTLRSSMETLYEQMAQLTRLLPRPDAADRSTLSSSSELETNSSTLFRLQSMLEQLIAFYAGNADPVPRLMREPQGTAGEALENSTSSFLSDAVTGAARMSMKNNTKGGEERSCLGVAPEGLISKAETYRGSSGASEPGRGETQPGPAPKGLLKGSSDALTDLAVLLVAVSEHMERVDHSLQVGLPQCPCHSGASTKKRIVKGNGAGAGACGVPSHSPPTSVQDMLSACYHALEHGLTTIREAVMVRTGAQGGLHSDVLESEDAQQHSRSGSSVLRSHHRILYPTYVALQTLLESIQRRVAKVMMVYQQESGEPVSGGSGRMEVLNHGTAAPLRPGEGVSNGMVRTPPRSLQVSQDMSAHEDRGAKKEEEETQSYRATDRLASQRFDCEESNSDCSTTLCTAILLLSRAYSGVTRDLADLLWQRQCLLRMIRSPSLRTSTVRTASVSEQDVFCRSSHPVLSASTSVAALKSPRWCQGVLRFRVRVIVVLAVNRLLRGIEPQARECVRVPILVPDVSQLTAVSGLSQRRQVWVRLRLPQSSRVVLSRGDPMARRRSDEDTAARENGGWAEDSMETRDVKGDDHLPSPRKRATCREVRQQDVCAVVTRALPEIKGEVCMKSPSRGGSGGDGSASSSFIMPSCGLQAERERTGGTKGWTNSTEASRIGGLLMSLQQMVEATPAGTPSPNAGARRSPLVHQLRKGLSLMLRKYRQEQTIIDPIIRMKRNSGLDGIQRSDRQASVNYETGCVRCVSPSHHTHPQSDDVDGRSMPTNSPYYTVPSSAASTATSPLPSHISHAHYPRSVSDESGRRYSDGPERSSWFPAPPPLRRTLSPQRDHEAEHSNVDGAPGSGSVMVEDELSGLFAEEVLRVLNALDHRVTVALDRGGASS